MYLKMPMVNVIVHRGHFSFAPVRCVMGTNLFCVESFPGKMKIAAILAVAQGLCPGKA